MAPITQNEFGVLKEGLLSQKKGYAPLSRFGVDFTLTPQNVIFGALPLGNLAQIGDIINQQRVNQIARKALGKKPRNTFDAFTTGDFSATRELQSQLVDKYGEDYTREDVQNFAIQKFPELDLAPLTTRTTNQGEIPDNTAFTYDYDKGNYKFTQPFSSGRFAEQMTGVTDETGLKGEDFKSAMGSYALSRAIDQNLKTPDQFAEDKITQSNIRQSKNYDENFAKSVRREQQGDTADAESTFICTTLYRKGLLPRKIYLCDVIYGKNINFYTYKGYEVWGKWFAKKLQNNKTIYNIFYPIFVAWSKQMAFEVSKGKYGKNNVLLRFVKNICEKISYGIGWIYERSQKWNTQ